MKTREFNLNNYTGKTAIVSYAVKARTFEYQGYTFTIGKFEFVHGQDFVVSLYSGEWSGTEWTGSEWTGPIVKLYIKTDFETTTLMHAAVIAATRYAAMHI